MFSRILWIPLLSILLMGDVSRPIATQDLGSFDGAWQGKLEVVNTSSEDKDRDSYERTKAAYGKSPFRLTIHGQTASVYFGEAEVKPSRFQAQIYLTNAVVFASDAGEDKSGPWVETWDFAITQKNPETLIVVFSRVVNNLNTPEQPERSKFFVAAVGEFSRTSP